MSKLAELKTRLARQSGLNPDEIELDPMAQYDMLLSQGIGVRISISGASLFQVPLPCDLLGLSLCDAERDFQAQHVDLGKFFTAPRDVINELRSKAESARNYLRKVSKTVGFKIDSYVWVPIVPANGNGAEGFDQVLQKLRLYQADYLNYVNDLAARRADVKRQTIEHVKDVADLIYTRLYPGWHPKLSPAIIPPEFIDRLTAFVEDNFPTETEILSKCGFQIEFKAYEPPQLRVQDKLEVEKLAAERATLQLRVQGAERAAYEAAQERQRLILAEQQKYLEAERLAKEQRINPLLQDITQRIQLLINDGLDKTLDALRKSRSGSIPGPTLAMLQSMAQDLKPLALLAGSTKLDELRCELTRVSKRNGAPVQAQQVTSALDKLKAEIDEQAFAVEAELNNAQVLEFAGRDANHMTAPLYQEIPRHAPLCATCGLPALLIAQIPPYHNGRVEVVWKCRAGHRTVQAWRWRQGGENWQLERRN